MANISSSRILTKPGAPGSLRHNAAWSFAGNFVFAVCQWLMIVILARLGDAAVVGEFALALAVTTPVIMLASMQLRWVQATDSADSVDIRDCLTLRIVCITLGFAAITSIAWCSGYDQETFLVILAVAAAKSIEAVSDVLYGWFQQHERMEFISQSLVLRGLLSVAAVAIGYASTGSLGVASATLAAVWLAVLLLFDLPRTVKFASHHAQRPFGIRWNTPRMRTIFLRALPVGMTAGIVALQTNVPRYFVEHAWGREELGVFAAMAYVLLAAETLVRAVNQSAMPQLARHQRSTQQAAFRRVVRQLFLLGSVCALASVLAALFGGRLFLRYVYGAEFARDPHLLNWLVIATGISFVLRPAEVGLRAMRRFWLLLGVHLAGLPVFVGLTAMWVARSGTWGAAQAIMAQAVWHGVITFALYRWIASQSSPVPDRLSNFGAEPLRGPHFLRRETTTQTMPPAIDFPNS